MKIKLPKRHPSRKNVYKGMCWMHCAVNIPDVIDASKTTLKLYSWKGYVPFKTFLRRLRKMDLQSGATVQLSYNWEEVNAEYVKWKMLKPIKVNVRK